MKSLDRLSLYIYRGFSTISSGFSTGQAMEEEISPYEAISSDWKAICRDGALIQSDFAEAVRRAKSLPNGHRKTAEQAS